MENNMKEAAKEETGTLRKDAKKMTEEILEMREERKNLQNNNTEEVKRRYNLVRNAISRKI